MRGRRDGSGNGDVRQRREVVQRPSAGVDNGSELAVSDPSTNFDGAGFLVNGDEIEAFERDFISEAVGDGTEGGAQAERAQFGAALHGLAYLFNGARREQMV